MWKVLQKSDGIESKQNKTYVDGDDTETPETTALLKSKLRDYANRASFKTSPTRSNCRRAADVATVARNRFLLSKLSQIVSHKAELGFFAAHIM